MQNFFYTRCLKTGRILKQKNTSHWDELLSQLEQLHNGYKKLKISKIQNKIKNLEILKDITQQNEKNLVAAISDDMGKITQEAQLEFDKTIGHFDYFIQHGQKFLTMKTWRENQNQFCQFPEPIGVIYKITPFNFPLWIAMKSSIPNLLLGNTMAVKVTESCLNTAEYLDKIFKEFSPEYTQVLYPNRQESMKIIKCGYVQGVSFTGGEKGGQQVAQTAAQYLKKTVLELGGSDPCIIGKTKNNQKTIEEFLKGRLMNMGQVCSSPKRVFVLNSLKNIFIETTKQFLNKLPEVTHLVNQEAFEQVYDQVDQALQDGDKLLYGQLQKSKSQKKMYPLLIQCKKDSNLLIEEVFGPIIAVRFINDLEEGIVLANKTRFGLGASIFYHDYKKAEQLAKNIEVGQVSINGICTSNSGLPWGGIKNSGYGIESGQFGMEYFANIKTIIIPRDKYHKIYKQIYQFQLSFILQFNVLKNLQEQCIGFVTLISFFFLQYKNLLKIFSNLFFKSYSQKQSIIPNIYALQYLLSKNTFFIQMFSFFLISFFFKSITPTNKEQSISFYYFKNFISFIIYYIKSLLYKGFKLIFFIKISKSQSLQTFFYFKIFYNKPSDNQSKFLGNTLLLCLEPFKSNVYYRYLCDLQNIFSITIKYIQLSESNQIQNKPIIFDKYVQELCY